MISPVVCGGFVGKKAEYNPAAKGEYGGADAIAIPEQSGRRNPLAFSLKLVLIL
jgi:hypothetical protein